MQDPGLPEEQGHLELTDEQIVLLAFFGLKCTTENYRV